MINILIFLIITIVVGIITAFLNIKFDRFFTIIMLIFVALFDIKKSVEIVLWVVFFGAITVLLSNKNKISLIPRKNKIKLLTIIPLLSFLGAIFGSYLFFKSSNDLLIIVLGILSISYGIRLIIIHFKSCEIDYKNTNIFMMKFCGSFGAIISGFSLGFIGTSLKPLKIPFAVKFGKLNLKQVYIGNTIIAAYASFFAILFHILINKIQFNYIYENFIIGLSLWAVIHFISIFSNILIKDKWRKPVQITVGIALILVSIKIFMLV